MKRKKKSKKQIYLNLLFIIGCSVLLLFLFIAPEETTSRLPHDEIHNRFHQIKSKKEADTLCVECHAPGADQPLSKDHPEPFRCLFCHKRDM